MWLASAPRASLVSVFAPGEVRLSGTIMFPTFSQASHHGGIGYGLGGGIPSTVPSACLANPNYNFGVEAVGVAATQSRGQVIKVCDEIPCCKTPLNEANLSEILKSICGGGMPHTSMKFSTRVVQPYGLQGMFQNALVSAVHTAWVGNYPLVLTPDVIWTAIQQGYAKNGSFTGPDKTSVPDTNTATDPVSTITSSTQSLRIQVGSNALGTDNYWHDVFQGFSKKIIEADPSTCTPSFSTSGPQERAVAHLSLMNACGYGYVYEPTYGIPTITVTGTKEDWTLLCDNALTLASKCTNAQDWSKALKPVLDQFISAASGEFDQKFWRSIYHCFGVKYKGTPAFGLRAGGEESAESSGWIFALLPFSVSVTGDYPGNYNTNVSKYLKQIKDHVQNDTPVNISYIQQPGIRSDVIPSGIVTTFATHDDLKNCTGSVYRPQSKFYSGFMVVGQEDQTMAIHPEIGWAVSL